MTAISTRDVTSMSQDTQLFTTWQLTAPESGKVRFQTQDQVLQRMASLVSGTGFQGLVTDYFITKCAKHDVKLHAWCSAANRNALLDTVLDNTASCQIVEMEMNNETDVCYPAFGQIHQETVFRVYLRQVSEITLEMLAADRESAKRHAIQSKYVADPDRVLSPLLSRLSPKYRSLDEPSRRLFWKLFKTRETDTPWSYFFYNLVLGLDWSAEQMTESEAATLLLTESAEAPSRKEK
ncbi:MAG: hypothetical protein V2A77_02055 [Pseudomonadota bacterium]